MSDMHPAITINFSTTSYRRILRIRQGLFAAAALLGLSAGALLWTADSLRAQNAVQERQMQEFAASVEKLRPAMRERQQLVKDLGAMTGLLEARRFSWTQLLTRIEAVSPSGVALTSVQLSGKEQAVALEGTAQSPEALSNLMIGLQRSRSFRNPLLKHQSLDKGNLSFNVAVHYQEHLEAGPAPDADQKPGQ